MRRADSSGSIGGADEAVPGLGDHERLAHAHDAFRLLQDRFDAPGILIIARDLARPFGRFDVVEPHDASFRLRHGLLREDGDVAVFEREFRDDQLGEIVSGADLRQPFDRDDADFPQLSPVSRKPACAL